MCGCGGGGQQNSTTTQISSPPPEYLQAYQQVLGQAQGVSQTPLNQYQGNQVAPFTPDQQQAFGTISNAQSAASPYLQQANSYLQQAAAPLWANTAQYSPGAAQQYMPTGVPQFSQAVQQGYQPNNVPQYSQSAMQGFMPQGLIDPNSVQFNQNYSAGNLINPSSAQFNQNFSAGNLLDPRSAQFNQNFSAGNLADPSSAQFNQNFSAGNTINPGSLQFNQNYSPGSMIDPSGVQISPQQFSAGSVAQYLSPYTQQVVDATQAQFHNQNAQQANQLKGSAASAGAFGGDREAVMQAQLAGQQQLAQAPVIAGLYNQGYSQALGEFNNQQQTGLQAQQEQIAARLAAQQQRSGFNLQAQGLGLTAQQAQAQAQLAAQQQQGGFNLQAQGMGSAAQQAQYQAMLQAQQQQGQFGLQAQTLNAQQQQAQFQAMLAAQQQQGQFGLQAQGMSAAQQQAQFQAMLAAQQQQGQFGLTAQQLGLSAQQAQAQAQQGAQSQQLQGFGMGQNQFNNQQQAYLQAYGMGNQQLNAQQQLAMQQYGVGLGEFNTQQQQQLAANEANAWLNSQAGFGSMNLASQAQNLPLSAASAQLQSGALQQQLAQEYLNIPYEQFLQQQAYPFQTTGWLANIASGLGSNAGGTATTTQPSGNTYSQLAGLGTAGLSLFGGGGGSSGGWTNNSNLGSYASGIGSSLTPGFGLSPTFETGGAVRGGSNVIPFRKRGGMVPHRDMGGIMGSPILQNDPLENQDKGPDDPFALPKIPNVDVNFVGEGTTRRGPGPPKPPKPDASGGGDSGGGLGGLLDLGKTAMSLFALLNAGGAVGRSHGGMIPRRDLGGALPLEMLDPFDTEPDHVLGVPKVPNVNVNFVPQETPKQGSGPPQPSAPEKAQAASQSPLGGLSGLLGSMGGMGGGSSGGSSGSGDKTMEYINYALDAAKIAAMFLADGGAVGRQSGGMIPHRADGGLTNLFDNSDDSGDQIVPTPARPSVNQTARLGDNFGFTQPDPVSIKPQETDYRHALLAAGLGMMAGTSGNALQNIAEGGMYGLKQYDADKKSNLEQAEKQGELDEANNRNTISFQEAKTRAAQMADDMEQKRYQGAITQKNQDRTAARQEASDAWQRKYQGAELGIRQRELDQGRYSTPVPGMGVDSTGKSVPGAWTENTRTGELSFHPGTIIDKGGSGAGSISGRESVFTNRVIGGANAATAAVRNLMELPISTNAGIFGGRGQGPGLLDAMKEDLANTITAPEAQEFNKMFSGLTRNLASLETQGMAPNGPLMTSLAALTVKEGDTEMTKLRTFAEMRQIIDTNLEPLLWNPRIPEEQKGGVRKILAGIDAAVPFTHHDITEFEYGKKHKLTFSDYAKQNGLGRVPPAEKREDGIVYQTPKGPLRWVAGENGKAGGWQAP